MFPLLLLITSAIPDQLFVEDYFDRVELNHFYDQDGRIVFDQLIFYNFDQDQCVYLCHAWCLMQDARNHHHDPDKKMEWDKKQAEIHRFPNEHLRVPYQSEWLGSAKMPVKNYTKDVWEVTFLENNAIRRIRSKSFVETHTQVDPELINRDLLPKEKRKNFKEIVPRKQG